MSKQLQVTGDMSIKNWTGSLSIIGGLVGYKGYDVANGVPLLDSSGKIQLSQLPSSVMTYMGTWNASTNVPYLVDGAGDTGDVYIVSVAGTHNFGSGPITFFVGDQVIYSGTIWERASGATGTVTSVAMTVPTGLTITGSPITTSGTLAVALASGYTIPLTTQLVPAAGTTGQILAKNSNTSYDTTWIDNYTEDVRDTIKATQAINKGQAVYISGANGTNQLGSLASYDAESTSSQTIGLALQTLATNGIGQIITYGLISGIDTSSATAGDPVWLGANGNLLYGIANKPSAPYHLVYMGVVTRSHAVNGEIFVRVSNGWELEELHDVQITSPSNNQVLYYQSSTDLWKNASIASILGYTPANAATYVPYTGATTDVDLGTHTLTTSNRITARDYYASNGAFIGSGGNTGYINLNKGSTTFVGSMPMNTIFANGFMYGFMAADGVTGNAKQAYLDFGSLTNNTTRTFSFPDASGTIALTSNLTSFITLTSLSATSPLSYNNTTGVFSIQVANTSQNGYLSSTDWNTFNSKQSALTFSAPLVNTSGTITITQATTSTNGYLSSTDWNTFNNKQNALTNPVTGTGTSGYHAKFTGTSTIGNSIIYDNGSNVGINTSSPISLGAGNTTLDIRSTSGSSLYLGTSSTGTLRIFADGTNAYVDNLIDTGAIIFRMTSTPNEAMRIASSRNILIGTTTDAGYKLDVNGTGRFSGDMTFGGNVFLADAVKALCFGTTSSYIIGSGASNYIRFFTNSTKQLEIASSGAATFSSSVMATNGIFSGSGNYVLKSQTSSTVGVFMNKFTNGNDEGLFFVHNGSSAVINASTTNSVGIAADYGTAGGAYRDLFFATSGYERMRITTSGNVGIGTTSFYDGNTKFQVTKSGYSRNIFQNSNDGTLFGIDLYDNTYGVNIGTISNHFLGIYTNSTERMRITSGGNLLVGTTTQPATNYKITTAGIAGVWVDVSGSGDAGYVSRGAINWHYYAINNSGTNVFYVSNNGDVRNTNNSYGAISDISLKENISDATSKLADLLKVKVRNYNLISDESKTKQIGVIAQELEEIFPNMISEDKQMGRDKTIKTVKYSIFVPMLIKATQELKAEKDAEIADLKEQIEELKALIKSK